MEIPSVISIVDKSTTFYKELLRLSKEVKPYLHNKGDPILIGARHSDLLVVQILKIIIIETVGVNHMVINMVRVKIGFMEYGKIWITDVVIQMMIVMKTMEQKE